MIKRGAAKKGFVVSQIIFLLENQFLPTPPTSEKAKFLRMGREGLGGWRTPLRV